MFHRYIRCTEHQINHNQSLRTLCSQNSTFVAQFLWVRLGIVEFCMETCVDCFLLFVECLNALNRTQFYERIFLAILETVAKFSGVITVCLWPALPINSLSNLPVLWNLLKKVRIINEEGPSGTLNNFWKLRLVAIGMPANFVLLLN